MICVNYGFTQNESLREYKSEAFVLPISEKVCRPLPETGDAKTLR